MLRIHHTKYSSGLSATHFTEIAGRVSAAIAEFRREVVEFTADPAQPKLPNLDFIRSILDIESKIFRRYAAPSFSLFAQIDAKILSHFTERHFTAPHCPKPHCGIVFIGFEQTICSPLAIRSAPFSLSTQYSEAPGRVWVDVVRSLRAKGFMVVMCINQCEDRDSYLRHQSMITEISPEFDACLYISDVFPRAAIMAYVQRMIAETSHAPITDLTFLVDCDPAHVEMADMYGIKNVIHTKPVIPTLYGLLPPVSSSPIAGRAPGRMSPIGSPAALVPPAGRLASRPGSLGGFSFGDEPHSFVSVGSTDLKDLKDSNPDS